MHPGDVVIETVAREYLEPLAAEGVDTLVLGCTHYPLLTEVIGGVMGADVALVNSGAEAALELRELLMARDALAEERTGVADFYASDRPEDFQRLAGLFLQERLDRSVKQIDIDRY